MASRWVLAVLAGCGAALVSLPVAAAAGAQTAASGDWVWPLTPRPVVVHGFDPPPEPWFPGHRGVDLAGSEGQRVLSAGAGEVTYAGTLAGIGVVVVRHGELRTTYQPVDAAVDVGDEVDAGDAIGRLESAGSHCAPRVCLHWGLIRGQTYLDPLLLVGAGPVRLLPLGAESLSRHRPAPPLLSDSDRASSVGSAQGAVGGSAWPAMIGGLGGAGGVLLLVRARRPTDGLKPGGEPGDRQRAAAR